MRKKANIIAGFLFWLIALVCVALFLPVMLEATGTLPSSVTSFTNGTIIGIIITYFPLFLGLFLLFVLFIILRSG